MIIFAVKTDERKRGQRPQKERKRSLKREGKER